jgi:hypothetical protein
MQRRDLLTAGALGTLLGALVAPAEAAQSSASNQDRGLDRIADAIAALRTEWRGERQFPELAPIRTAQKTFLRANGKLPDFMELGADIWFAVYDWHVRWQHPIVEGRDPQNRLTLALNGTQVILRADVVGTYVGLPYDAR